MKITSLSDPELLSRTENLAFQERELTSQIIDHLREIEKRRLFAKLGFSSLFEYVTKHLKYCHAGAQLRIDAMRFSKVVPEVKVALEIGTVSLSTVGVLQKFFRAEEKTYSSEEKRALLEQVENKSKLEAEKFLMGISPVELKTKEKTRVLNEKETELKLVASEQLMGLIDQMKLKLTRKGESAPGLAEVFEEALKRALGLPVRNSTSPGEVKIKKRPYIPVAMKREVFQKSSSQCSYLSPLTGRRCAETRSLQIEHLKPFAQGGSSEPENLTLLCATHNRFRAVEFYGEKTMQRYLRE